MSRRSQQDSSADYSDENEEGSSSMMYIVIAVAGALLIAAIVIIAVCCCKKDEGDAAANTGGAANADSNATGNTENQQPFLDGDKNKNNDQDKKNEDPDNNEEPAKQQVAKLTSTCPLEQQLLNTNAHTALSEAIMDTMYEAHADRVKTFREASATREVQFFLRKNILALMEAASKTNPAEAGGGKTFFDAVDAILKKEGVDLGREEGTPFPLMENQPLAANPGAGIPNAKAAKPIFSDDDGNQEANQGIAYRHMYAAGLAISFAEAVVEAAGEAQAEVAAGPAPKASAFLKELRAKKLIKGNAVVSFFGKPATPKPAAPSGLPFSAARQTICKNLAKDLPLKTGSDEKGNPTRFYETGPAAQTPYADSDPCNYPRGADTNTPDRTAPALGPEESQNILRVLRQGPNQYATEVGENWEDLVDLPYPAGGGGGYAAYAGLIATANIVEFVDEYRFLNKENPKLSVEDFKRTLQTFADKYALLYMVSRIFGDTDPATVSPPAILAGNSKPWKWLTGKASSGGAALRATSLYRADNIDITNHVSGETEYATAAKVGAKAAPNGLEEAFNIGRPLASFAGEFEESVLGIRGKAPAKVAHLSARKVAMISKLLEYETVLVGDGYGDVAAAGQSKAKRGDAVIAPLAFMLSHAKPENVKSFEAIVATAEKKMADIKRFTRVDADDALKSTADHSTDPDDKDEHSEDAQKRELNPAEFLKKFDAFIAAIDKATRTLK